MAAENNTSLVEDEDEAVFDLEEAVLDVEEAVFDEVADEGLDEVADLVLDEDEDEVLDEAADLVLDEDADLILVEDANEVLDKDADLVLDEDNEEVLDEDDKEEVLDKAKVDFECVEDAEEVLTADLLVVLDAVLELDTAWAAKFQKAGSTAISALVELVDDGTTAATVTDDSLLVEIPATPPIDDKLVLVCTETIGVPEAGIATLTLSGLAAAMTTVGNAAAKDATLMDEL